MENACEYVGANCHDVDAALSSGNAVLKAAGDTGGLVDMSQLEGFFNDVQQAGLSFTTDTYSMGDSGGIETHIVTGYNSDAGGETLWTTWDFVNHYFTGKGTPVDLRNVGLANEFENSKSVKSLTNSFEHDVLDMAIPGLTSSQVGISDVTDEPNLFAVGHSTFFMNASCGGNSCTFNYSIRDWFRDPLSEGLEIPGGTPYRINNDWSVVVHYP